jgi:hypothetical protein
LENPCLAPIPRGRCCRCDVGIGDKEEALLDMQLEELAKVREKEIERNRERERESKEYIDVHTCCFQFL